MRAYSVKAINVGSFALGETDKVLTLFAEEKGIIRAVAKGARKPGSKIAGRADVLNVNQLLLAPGKTFEIIQQAQSLETFPGLRKDLERLSFGLYYAELTHFFGQGLEDEAPAYFEYLLQSLALQAKGADDAAFLGLIFELSLLDRLGYKPELDYCVVCRKPLTESKIELFHYDLGGIICSDCINKERIDKVRERQSAAVRGANDSSAYHDNNADDDYSDNDYPSYSSASLSTRLTPLVWKQLIRAESQAKSQAFSEQTSNVQLSLNFSNNGGSSQSNGAPVRSNLARAIDAARRVIQSYIEHRAGKRMKSLDLIGKL